VLAALRAEFHADRCVVLPAVSFHVDLEVTVRATPSGLVACVLDTTAAARIVIQCGLDALTSGGILDAEANRAARADLDANRHAEFFARVGPLLQPHQHSGGRFTLEFAQRFSAGPTDSGVGNLQRFLLALDLWSAASIGEATAEDLGVDADSFAYLDSLRRREVERMRVAAALEGLGWTVVPVAGFSDGTRSLNPLNGLQLTGRYLMPAYGGLFAPLDAAARERLAAAYGSGVAVDPVLCGETQRRAGGRALRGRARAPALAAGTPNGPSDQPEGAGLGFPGLTPRYRLLSPRIPTPTGMLDDFVARLVRRELSHARLRVPSSRIGPLAKAPPTMIQLRQRFLGVATAFLGVAALTTHASAQCTPTANGQRSGRDRRRLDGPANYNSDGTYEALSIGTTSCNIGNVWLNWFANTNQHPVIGQTLYRLKVVDGAGRFEQVGQGWLKHGFYALSEGLCCSGCQSTNGQHLGVHCSDPYTASRNGSQTDLGPSGRSTRTSAPSPTRRPTRAGAARRRAASRSPSPTSSPRPAPRPATTAPAST
jgi:hypothetical protein